jgi:hypothetical protein
MPLVIHGLLNESREYYRALKRELVGQLLINPCGHLRRNVVHEKTYLSLRQCRHGKCREVYIGQEHTSEATCIMAGLEISKRAIVSLREAKRAMRELHMPQTDIRNEDFFPVIQRIFQAFGDQGLWEEGLELVGSWCFKIYQNYCGVAYYPDRSLDVDFAVTIPYPGKPKDLGKMLKELGFIEEFNYGDGSIAYKSGDFKVEFLKNRVGNGKARTDTHQEERDLGIIPQALPYLGILLDHPMALTARDLGKVVVPTMPAFLLHKLLVAEKRKKEDKRAKDYRQVDTVARAIMDDEALIKETDHVFHGLHKTWQAGIEKSARRLAESYPWQSGAVAAVLERIRQGK